MDPVHLTGVLVRRDLQTRAPRDDCSGQATCKPRTEASGEAELPTPCLTLGLLDHRGFKTSVLDVTLSLVFSDERPGKWVEEVNEIPSLQ